MQNKNRRHRLFLRMQNPILVETYRSSVMESFQRGVVCVVDKAGKILFSLGDTQQVCYPRSALKFLQVIPLLESGAAAHFGFTNEEIAIMCGSHNGEPEHQRVVRSILQKIGLTEDALNCGAQYPSDKKTNNELIRHNEKPQHIHNNCSGKHAGFLAYCVYHKLDTQSYLDPNNALHQEVMKVVGALSGYPASKMVTAYDGCSAPIFSMPVYHMAVMFQKLTDPEAQSPARSAAIKQLVAAVQQYPYMVAGSKRYCTEMMQICGERVIGKTGAEGVFCMSFLQEKLGAAIKIDDGKMHPQYVVAQTLIERSGIFPKEKLQPLHHYIEEPIKNFNGYETGVLQVNAGLFDNFSLQ